MIILLRKKVNNIVDLAGILNQLPIILEYFIPGFLFVRIFQILTSRKDSTYQLIISVAVSYILKAFCSIVHEYILTDINFSWNWRVLILSIFAAVSSVILVCISEIKFVNRILLHINNKSLHDDIWQDIIDYRNGTTLRFICGDTTYIGTLVIHEERGNDSWFVLDDYIVEEKNSKYKAEDMNFRSRIAINLRDVDRVELYYGDLKETFFDKMKSIFIRNKSKDTVNKEQEN